MREFFVLVRLIHFNSATAEGGTININFIVAQKIEEQDIHRLKIDRLKHQNRLLQGDREMKNITPIESKTKTGVYLVTRWRIMGI